MAFPSPSKRNQKPQECQEQEVSDFSWQLSGRYLFIVNGCDKSWSHFSHSRALLRGRLFSSNSRLKPVSYLLLSWKELCQYFCIYEKPECFTRDSSAANTMPVDQTRCWLSHVPLVGNGMMLELPGKLPSVLPAIQAGECLQRMLPCCQLWAAFPITSPEHGRSQQRRLR